MYFGKLKRFSKTSDIQKGNEVGSCKNKGQYIKICSLSLFLTQQTFINGTKNPEDWWYTGKLWRVECSRNNITGEGNPLEEASQSCCLPFQGPSFLSLGRQTVSQRRAERRLMVVAVMVC